jgi:sec-independent protein translocase protein TatA
MIISSEISLPLAWSFGGPELIFIFLVVLLLFGGKKLPELARALGQAKKEFHKASKEAEEEASKDNSSKNGDSSSKKA